MARLGLVAMGFALMVGLVVCDSTLVQAQAVASIALPSPRSTVRLYVGCNNIALSFPDGTASQTVVQAVTPAGLVQAMWRHNAAQNRFEGFSPAAPQASDLLTVNLWDAVWLCVAGGAPSAPPAPPAAAAPTLTPPPQPTPGPVVPPAESFTVRKTSDYMGASTGTLHVVGEVVNNDSSDAEYVEITGTFFDQAGNVLASDFTYSCLDVIPAGGDSPFHMLVLDAPPGIVRYTLQVQGEAAGQPPPLGLDISGVTTDLTEWGTFHVLGLVTNNSQTTYQYVRICAALYDSAGNVIRSDSTYTQLDSLAPGQSSSFDCLEIDAPPVASNRLWVQGSPE
jgi:hypothetical protein